MNRALPFVIIGAVGLAAVTSGALLYRAKVAELTPVPNAAAGSAESADTQKTRASDTHVRGNPKGTITIEEFGDFQCPPCGQFHPIMSRIERDFPTQVRFSFRHFPIKTQHPHAVLAAHATEAAGLQGKFWELHDVIYEKQSEWKDAKDARPIFTNYARALGLDMQKFAQDIDSTPASMRLVVDERRAQTLGVTGTPTVFINGREIPFPKIMNYDALRNEINAELAQAKK